MTQKTMKIRMPKEDSTSICRISEKATDFPMPYTVVEVTPYSQDRFDNLISTTLDALEKLIVQKGGEYSGDFDRLANFRRNAMDCGLLQEQIWRVYAAKHWDAIGQYIRDLGTNTTRPRSEPISGRVDDLLVYLLLFKAMLDERGAL
jgi:hypothetical protein